MIEIYTVLIFVKLLGSASYFILAFGSDEDWSKVTRLILAIVSLVFNIIAVIIGVQCEIAGAIVNLINVFIWLYLTVMGINRLRE